MPCIKYMVNVSLCYKNKSQMRRFYNVSGVNIKDIENAACDFYKRIYLHGKCEKNFTLGLNFTKIQVSTHISAYKMSTKVLYILNC